MKKANFIVLLLLGFLVSTALYWNCSKNDFQNDITEVKEESGQSQSHEDRIIAFKEMMYSNLKSGPDLSVDSAILYWEATLNFDYAIADSFFTLIDIDSFFVDVSLTQSNLVPNEDLSDVYDQLVDSLEVHYRNISGSYKHVLVSDLEEVSTASQTLSMKLISIMGKDNSVWEYSRFDTIDYWYWGEERGKCNNYTGDGDAAQELEYHINHPISSSGSSSRYYYNNVETFYNINAIDYPDENYTGEWGEYRLFETEGSNPAPDYDFCICPDDMNYYLYDGVEYIIDDKEPAGKDFIYCLVEEEYLNAPNNWGVMHMITISFGVRYSTTVPAEEL